MQRLLARGLTGLALTAALGASLATPALAEAPTPSITITATGAVTAEPDQATIGFSVHSTDEVAREAMRKNTELMAQAYALLGDIGVSPQDIATSSIALQPRYDSNSSKTMTAPRILGYEARNSVTVTVHDLTKLGAVLDGLVESGVNAIGNVSFGISDPSELEADARARAARDARAKAEAYAEAIGTKVTGVLSISESYGHRPQPYAMEMARVAASAPVPVSGGEMDVSATVNVVFTLSGDLD